MRNCRSNRINGFSLIELLVVLVIMGLLASLISPNLFNKVGASKQKTAKAQISLLSSAIDTYRLDVNYFPEQLAELVQSPKPNWQGPYLKELPLDPWGNAYLYRTPGDNGFPYALLSHGRDGKPGGEGEDADVSN